ncbi:MAG: SemiSWEET transporter [Candidatus Margulisiibacteriota bacterium]
MDRLFWLGIAAGTLTTAAFLPQVIKTISTRHTKDISLLMYVLFSVGLILWTIYGLQLGSWPVIIANSVTLVLAFTIIYLKLKHG